MGAQVAANSNSANRNAELADVKKARGFLESHIFAFQEYAMEVRTQCYALDAHW